jgi:hypothetical protein
MAKAWRAALVGTAAVLLFGVAPFVFFRMTYTHGKRLREVVRGRVYRSGQMDEAGFAEAVARFGLRTVVNVQDEVPDPDIARGYWTRKTVKESELCRRLGVRYVHLAPDLVHRQRTDTDQPKVIGELLALLDQESTYPVLIHCKAGLHRTGVLCAVYRREYQGWSAAAAFRELKAHGFGPWACTAANDYVNQYVLSYRPRQGARARAEASARP